MAAPTLQSILEASSPQIILTGRKLVELPEALRARQGVTHLGVQRNLLRALPDWLGELTSLMSLYVGQNPLEALPDGLGALPSLQRLLLSETALTRPARQPRRQPRGVRSSREHALARLGAAFAVLARCPRLSSLALDGNPGIEAHLDGLPALRSLRQVYLSACELTAVPPALWRIEALTDVSLFDNPLTHVPDALVLLPSLPEPHAPQGPRVRRRAPPRGRAAPRPAPALSPRGGAPRFVAPIG